MKRIMTVILLSLALAVAAFAQEAKPKPAEGMPTADQIIEKYVQAMGGKAAIEKLNSRTTKASFEIPSMGAAARSKPLPRPRTNRSPSSPFRASASYVKATTARLPGLKTRLWACAIRADWSLRTRNLRPSSTGI